MKKTLIIIIVLAIIAVIWYKASHTTSTTTEQRESPPTNNPGEGTIKTLPATNVQTFNVTGANFKFNPAEIRVKKGDTVRVIFSSAGGLHDWVVDEFNAKTNRLQSGQSETIEFVASKTGTFEYYCSVGTHRQMGMVGKLIVE